MAGKETTLVILDTNKGMFGTYHGEEGKTNMDIAFEAVLMLMQ